MIDPAVLRPGRLDVKDSRGPSGASSRRPEQSSATDLTADKLPLSPNVDAKGVRKNRRAGQRHLRAGRASAPLRHLRRPWPVASGVPRRRGRPARCSRTIADRAKTYAVKLSITTGQGCGRSASICWPKPWTKNTVRPGTRCWMWKSWNSGAASTGSNPDG